MEVQPMKHKYQVQEKIPEQKQPREKLIEQGPDVLKNAELVAILLNTGYRGESVAELASRILQEYGSKAIIKQRNVNRLMDDLGLPPVKACQIIACFELGRRFFMEDTGKMPTVRSSEDVYNYTKEIGKFSKEQFRGLYLNARNKLIHDEVISIGTLTANLVHPREVFQPAIEFLAAAIILVHNHPSGDPEPSKDDIIVTRQLIEVSKIMGFEILDHIVVGKERYVSMKDRKII